MVSEEEKVRSKDTGPSWAKMGPSLAKLDQNGAKLGQNQNETQIEW